MNDSAQSNETDCKHERQGIGCVDKLHDLVSTNTTTSLQWKVWDPC